MKKKKPLILAAIFVVIVIIINNMLNFMLVQPGLSRTIIHEADSGDYQCVILGASHGSYGLATNEIGEEIGQKTLNMCIGGEYIYDSYYLLKYAMKKNKNLKTVIVDVDYQYLVNQHDESILFNNIYNAYPTSMDKVEYYFTKMIKEEYRGTFLRWTNYWQCYYMIDRTIKKKLSDDYKNYSANVVSMNVNDTYKEAGFIYRDRKAVKSTTSCIQWDESKVDKGQCRYLKKMVDLCKSKGINVVFTTVVQDPATIAGQYEKFAGADSYIQKLADSSGVTYINFNALRFDVFDRTTDDFYDREGHMYGDTAERFSTIYGEAVKKVLEGTYVKSDYMAASLNRLYSNYSNAVYRG